MTTYYNKTTFILLISLSLFFSCSENKKAVATTDLEQEQSTPITVTGSDFSNFAKIGSKYTSETLNISKVNSVPQGGENQIWDFREYKDENHTRDTTHDNHPVPAGSSFTSATFVREHQSDFHKDLNYTEFFEVSEEGFYKLGVKVNQATVNLGNGILLTSTGEEDPITPKDLIFKFPMNYKDKTHYEGFLVEQYQLTAPPFDFSDAPVERKLTSNVKSEVIGWGKLILPHEALEDTTEVLLIKNTESVTVNYLVNDTTAPEALLSPLGLKEGATHEMIFYNFVSKEHGVIMSMDFNVDDNTKKVVFPAHFASYTIEKHF